MEENKSKIKYEIKYHSGEDADTKKGYAVICPPYLNIENEEGGLIDRWDLKDLRFDPFHLDRKFLQVSNEPHARIEMIDIALTENIDHLKKTVLQEFFSSKKFLIAGVASVVLILFLAVFFVESLSLKIAQLIPQKIEQQIFSSIKIDQYFSVCQVEDQEIFQKHLNQFFSSKKIETQSLNFISKIKVIKDPIVNAFVFPDGSIYITERLIKQADSYDEIVGVIGHELGHLKYRHHMQSIVRSSFVSLFIGALSGDFSVFLVDPSLVAGIYNLKYSRQLESQADTYGIDFLKSLDMSYQGMIEFFKKMETMTLEPKKDLKDQTTDTNNKWSWTEFLLTHPMASSRIKEIQSQSEQKGLRKKELTILSDELRSFSCR